MVEGPPQERQPGVKKYLNVPHIKQTHRNWCGYASVAMVLQYYEYPVEQVDVFRQVHPTLEYSYRDELVDLSHAPHFHGLARAANKLIRQKRTDNPDLQPLQAKVFTDKDYKGMLERLPNLQPEDILRSYLRRDIPLIVRVPFHTVVVSGIDMMRRRYSVNNPSLYAPSPRELSRLHEDWESREKESRFVDVPNYDTSHLMLVISKSSKAA